MYSFICSISLCLVGTGQVDEAVKTFDAARKSLNSADGNNELALASVNLQLGLALAKQGIYLFCTFYCMAVDAMNVGLGCGWGEGEREGGMN
jgi:hypothetical protein